MQQDQRGRVLWAGFPVEDVLPVNFGEVIMRCVIHLFCFLKIIQIEELGGCNHLVFTMVNSVVFV